MEIERVKGKIMEGQPGFPRQYGPSRSDHQPGIPFFPQETARDFVLIFLLTALLFFLSAFVTPFLGPARSPQISELIVPDWYLLFSWGLLKVADVFPQFVIGDGTPLKTDFNAAFWGDLLIGLTSYIGLRRLGYQPMRKWLFPYVGGLTVIVVVQAAAIFLIPGWLGPEVRPYVVQLGVFLLVLLVPMLVASVAVFALPESQARKWVVRSGVAAFVVFGALVAYFTYSGLQNHLALSWVFSVLYPNTNTLLLMPMFAVLTAYLGVRRPYSTYEYLLNECYQCGKCHTVCPVTKVEDDALGGLNLVYNTFKKQHDGVPLWRCLACEACSAVCPLDIQYSDYILEERSKVHARMAADGGRKE